VNVKNDTYKTLKFAEAKANAMVAAALGEDSTCAVFSNPFNGEFTEAQKRAIASYVSSWISEPLSLALDSIEGNRDWATEEGLRAFATDRAAIHRLKRY